MIDWLVDILSYQVGSPLMFNSRMFWLLFIVFLPFYGLLSIRRNRMAMIVYVIVFSLFFYYKASGLCCLLLVARAVIDYYFVRIMGDSPNPRLRKALLVLSLLLSVGTLAFFKYTNFLLFNLDIIVGANFQPLDIVLPVGISFYTFQSVSYVVDVYKRRTQRAQSLLDYMFYLSFFPYVAAGPIVRASAFLPQIRAQRNVTETMVYSGLWLVMVGLVKKAVVADYLAQYNNLVFSMPSGYSGFECLMGVLGYSIQIFCDFSGYSDIAIGIARIMGFDLGINFRSPYKSLNMTEFWRRWHISLSLWLKDYVYIPLGGNRKGRLRTYVNLMVTMLIGGIWHGAGWNFIVWGGMHGVGLVVHKFCKSRFDSVSNLFTMCLSWALTFSFVTALWIFFRSPDFAGAMEMIGSIVADFRAEMIVPFLSARIGWVNVFLLSVIAVFLPERLYGRVESWFIFSKLWVKIIVFISVVQLILEFSGSEVSPFIYFQF